MKGRMSLKKVLMYHGTIFYVSNFRPIGNAFRWNLTFGNACFPKSLRIVTLQNVEDLLSLADTGTATTRCTSEVYEQSSHLLPRRQHVNDSLKHEYKMLYLTFAFLCILLSRIHIQAWPSVVVEAEDVLLASLGFL